MLILSVLLIPGKAPITKWTETETTALLMAYNTLKRSNFQCDLWRRIAYRVQKQGFNRSANQLSAKIMYMKRTYLADKKANRLNMSTSDPYKLLVHETFGGIFVAFTSSSDDDDDN
jgi:hypothetical protein